MVAGTGNHFLEIEGRVQTPGLFSFQANWRLERMVAVGQNESPTLALQEWGVWHPGVSSPRSAAY